MKSDLMQPESNGREQGNDQEYSQGHQPNFAVIGPVERDVLSVAPYHHPHKSEGK